MVKQVKYKTRGWTADLRLRVDRHLALLVVLCDGLGAEKTFTL